MIQSLNDETPDCDERWWFPPTVLSPCGHVYHSSMALCNAILPEGLRGSYTFYINVNVLTIILALQCDAVNSCAEKYCFKFLLESSRSLQPSLILSCREWDCLKAFYSLGRTGKNLSVKFTVHPFNKWLCQVWDLMMLGMLGVIW